MKTTRERLYDAISCLNADHRHDNLEMLHESATFVAYLTKQLMLEMAQDESGVVKDKNRS